MSIKNNLQLFFSSKTNRKKSEFVWPKKSDIFVQDFGQHFDQFA